MSCERKVQTFETVEVKIDTCNKQEIEELENSIVSSLNQKLEKLNILIKNCNVYSNGQCILIHDRFNICANLQEIAAAFGLKCELAQCLLKGKAYLITDRLLNVLQQIDVSYDFGCIVANQKLTSEIEEIMGMFGKNGIDSNVLEMVRNIRKHGVYTANKTRKVNETYYDGKLIERTSGSWSINEETIISQLLKIAKEAEEVIKKTNTQLRDGTTKLIYERARQMGYAVQEIKKGTQTQLVLVRYE